MSVMQYADFDLLIEPVDASAGTYRARVLNSPAGQASTEFTLPFSGIELENFLLRVGRTRRGLRWSGSSEMKNAREFGSKLYGAVFQGQLQSCLLRSLDLSNQQERGLRIRLRLSNAPNLVDLPWEYLYDTGFGRFLCHSSATPLIRYLDLPQTTAPLAVQAPLRVLVMISSPRDHPALDVDAEWDKMQGALADLETRGLVTVTRLPTASLSALQQQLRRERYHIFHFIGHGGFDAQTQDGVLLLEDENGLSRPVSGNHLGAILHNHRTLRLALLNACEGARTATGDPFAGVAQQLVRQNIPAVIAMQFEISDDAAITLAHEFYAALADGYPVDTALTEARVALFTRGNDIEWGTPVLYMRSPDGNLFDFTQAKESDHTAKVTQTHRLEAVLPSVVALDAPIELLVKVASPTSLPLAPAAFPPDIKAEDIEHDDDLIALKFPKEQETSQLGDGNLELRVVATEFEVLGATRQNLLVPPDQDSQLVRFLLHPKQPGSFRVSVEVYDEERQYLGNAVLETKVVEGNAAALPTKGELLNLNPNGEQSHEATVSDSPAVPQQSRTYQAEVLLAGDATPAASPTPTAEPASAATAAQEIADAPKVTPIRKAIFYVASFFIPLVGVILFFMYKNKPHPADRQLAQTVLLLSCISLLLVWMCSWIPMVEASYY